MSMMRKGIGLLTLENEHFCSPVGLSKKILRFDVICIKGICLQSNLFMEGTLSEYILILQNVCIRNQTFTSISAYLKL